MSSPQANWSSITTEDELRTIRVALTDCVLVHKGLGGAGRGGEWWGEAHVLQSIANYTTKRVGKKGVRMIVISCRYLLPLCVRACVRACVRVIISNRLVLCPVF